MILKAICTDTYYLFINLRVVYCSRKNIAWKRKVIFIWMSFLNQVDKFWDTVWSCT